MKNAAVIIAAALLAGCSTTAPTAETKIVEVKTVVREPCIEQDKVPAKPVYAVGRGPAPDEKAQAAILIRDFEAAERYGNAWEAAAAGCIESARK